MVPVLALSLLLVAYNSTIHLLPWFTVLYVPLNLGFGAVLAVAAFRTGLSTDDLGLDRSRIRDGLRVGGYVAGIAAVILATAAVIPVFQPLFTDGRLGNASGFIIAYRALLRIPFGTALFEEFAFRGLLLGWWQRVAGWRQAVIGSSVAFGLWHIRPAVQLLDANTDEAEFLTRVLVVGGAVAGTAVAGAFFAALRRRADSLVAPIVAHAAINSFALIAAAIVR